MRDLGAGLALYLAFERATTCNKGVTKFCGLRNNADLVRAYSARSAPKFFGNLQFFRASWAENLRDPDAGRLLFSDLNAIMTLSTLSDIVQYAQRTMAECTQLLGAGRAEFPEIL